MREKGEAKFKKKSQPERQPRQPGGQTAAAVHVPELDRSNKLSRIQDMFQDDEEFPEDENVGGVMAALDRVLR